MTTRRSLHTALTLSAVFILALPAQAAVLYNPCFGLLDIHGDPLAPLVDEDAACVVEDPEDPPVGDPTGGAPADEYLDLWTNVVFREAGGTLQAVGYSNAALGYATVHAYPPGAIPMPTTADRAGPCEALYYCVSFNVALTGAHSVDVVGVYQDACQGFTQRLWNMPSPGAGAPVTQYRGIRLAPEPPPECLAGTVAVFLIVDGNVAADGTYYAASVTNY